jgi:hypothetical protein
LNPGLIAHNTGKGACILPHGVLFRGSAEAIIRTQIRKPAVVSKGGIVAALTWRAASRPMCRRAAAR